MASLVHHSVRNNLVRPPSFLPNNLHYEVITGSQAYGVNNKNTSDSDVCGFIIPPKEIIFPHLAGIIPGFGNQGNKFEQWQQHHVEDKSAGREYDFTIYNIVKYFQLCMDNNPNMVDTLFVPVTCVLHSTQVGNLVRDNRKLFLSKKVWPKFRGYAYSQLMKMDSKQPAEDSKRKESIEKHGYDVKFAYHIIRLVDECEQILATGDLDLQRARKVMKSVRSGKWSKEKVKEWFERQLPILEDVYRKSELPEVPPENKIKKLLMECLEIHYGNLKGIVEQPDAPLQALKDIDNILSKVRGELWA